MTETTGSRQPDGGELYTLTDLAKLCGVSRQTVYRLMQSDPALNAALSGHRTQLSGHRTYTADALEALRKAVFAPNCPELSKSGQNCPDTLDTQADTLDTLQKDLAAATDERDTLRRQLDTLRADHAAELDAIEQKHSAELDDLRQQLEQLRRVCDRLRQERDDGRQDCEQLRDDLRQAAAERDALRILLEKAETTAEQLRQDVTEERQRCGELSNQLAQLAADAHRLTDQAQRLQLAAMQPPAMIGDGSTAAEQRPSLWARIFKRKGGRET